ncbi:WEB family protein At3g02930, chloroplastic-like [Hibiscus syriacus]|uniref:WEB family protein At3g02930, chloroplastic-like n=1 Tax=Hibiscus syriacus TaxID=106335 RepID=UPI001920A401|nr:WEB family protein At3g02930, chloroplastic-like [Hibiscus syriacus]
MATKSKSGLSETPTKVSPATARVASKLSRGLAAKPDPGSPSHLQGTRHSVDRSPRSSLNSKPTIDRGSPKVDPERGSPSPLRGTRHLVDRSPRSSPLNSKLAIDRRPPKVEPERGLPSPLQGTRHSVDPSPRSSSLNSKPSIDRGSPRLATPSEKSQTRIGKGSELQAQLNSVQDDLKKRKEQISLIEKEKAQAIDELKEARKAADEAHEKLREALVGQKRAEESLEIEKFRSVELEEAGIEAAHMKDKEWLNEIRSIRKKHASDAAALCSTIEELERVKQELAMVCDAKNQALNHANDATKIAEIHAEEVEFLSAELAQLKSLIDSESEKETNENKEMVIKCKQEIQSLKQQLEEAMAYEEMLIEKEAFIEQLNVELEAARIAESYALNIVEEWKKRFKELQMRLAEEKKLERSASESLDSVMEQLENNDKSLLNAKSEITALKEKVGFLEVTISKQIGDLVESEQYINIAKEETSEVTKLVESMKFELETAKEEKTRALNNEKLAASSVQTLLEEKTKLIGELENSRDEMEKNKKAMESLASALNQVSAEAREAKEKLLSSEKEHVNYEAKLEALRSVLKATKEKYETMLDDAQKEIDLLTSAFEQSKNEYPNSRTEWERKDENYSREKEISRLVNLLKQSEEEASAFKEEEAQLKESLEEVESEVIYLQEALREVQTESRELKTSLLHKETELQSVVRENEELHAREAASLKKAEELSKLLEEATMKRQRDEPSNCEKDYNLQPKAAVQVSKENRHGREENPKFELPSEQHLEVNEGGAKVENVDGQQVKEAETKHNKDDSRKVEFNMNESCKIENKEFSREREPEQKALVQEMEVSKGLINGRKSASKKKGQQKKKNALLSKFVSLLKKGSNNQK